MQRNHDDGPYQNSITLIIGPPGSGKTRLLAQIANEMCERDFLPLCVAGSPAARNYLLKELLSTENACPTYWGDGHIVMPDKVTKLSYDKLLIDNSVYDIQRGSGIPDILDYVRPFLDQQFDEAYVAITGEYELAADIIRAYPEFLSVRSTFKDSKGNYYQQITCLEPRN